MKKLKGDIVRKEGMLKATQAELDKVRLPSQTPACPIPFPPPPSKLIALHGSPVQLPKINRHYTAELLAY